MKKVFSFLIIIFFTLDAAFANTTNGEFKQLLKTGTPEQIQNAINNGVDMNMTEALCYSSHYSQQHGILKVLIDNGANLNTTECYSLGLATRTHPLTISTYYKNLITTEDLLKLGVPSKDFSFFATNNIELVKVFAKYSDSSSIEAVLSYARQTMNDTGATSYYREGCKNVAQYLQTIDVEMPEFKGKNKVDIVMQLGPPAQQMAVDKNIEVWTYYHHVGDTHYNGQANGTSTYWGYGVSTINANVSNGYTATNSEKLTLIFQDGVVTNAKKNYDSQIH